MLKKITLLIILIIVVVGIVYWKLRTEPQKSATEQNKTLSASKQEAEDATETELSKDVENASQSSSGNYSEGTGWSAYPKSSEPEPTPDVRAEIYVKSGSDAVQTVTAKKGDRVSVMFTANFRDEVVFEGYPAKTNIEPGKESTLAFYVNTPGTFAIKLASSQKKIGILEVR